MHEPIGPDLIRQAQRGDVSAIGTLFDRLYEPVLRYLGARVSDRQQAEDLAGEVFKRMIIALPQYRPMGLPFRAWLFRIAHNLLVDFYRRESNRAPVMLDETERQPDEGQADPAAIVERKLALEQAYAALDALDAAQRDVLTLRFLSGLSLREVALTLGKTEDSIKSLQRRALAALRLSLVLEDG